MRSPATFSSRLCRVGALALALVVAAPVGSQPATAVPLEERSFESAALGRALTYHLYLPASYSAESEVRYPVVYWLHGSGGFPPAILQVLAGRFHRAIESGAIPPVIVVFPSDGHGQNMWTDSKDGRVPMERAIIEELLPHIDETLRTVASAEGRVIEGGSMGGFGAARLGFKYPERFGAVSMLNPGPLQPRLDPADAPIVGEERAKALLERVYGNDAEYFRAQSPWSLAARNAAKIREHGLAVRHFVGEQDPTLPHSRRFSRHLTELGIAHDFEVLPGVSHNPRELFAALGESYWEFFRRFLD